MHLVVAFASPLAEGGTGPGPHAAWQGLALPHLAALLAGREPLERDEGDAVSLSPPHERALARALGWAGADGQLPWAAWHAQRDGIEPDDLAWGLMTPVHLQAGREQVRLADPDALALDEASSRATLEAIRPLFESEGCVLVWGAPLRWYVAHEGLAGLATASLDRVVGRHIEAWLPARAQARLFKRLQNETQMLLYTHPLTGQRDAAGQPAVNSYWLSGCGRAQPVRGQAMLDTSLRAAALAGDWAAWQEAWQALDAGPIAALAQQPGWRLTLAGERAAITYAHDGARRGLWQRLRGRLARATDQAALLAAL